MSVQELLMEKELIICVGSGGVGKTTTAASLGLRAALQGRRVMVLTIDPARRLANALGLESFGNTAASIDLSDFEGAGQLSALMLDTQTTFNELMLRMAPDPETGERILANPIYRTLSSTFASSQEYMAAEKLLDLLHEETWDLVILDTPPVKNALDFLDSSGRLSEFFDKKVMHWFLSPYDEGRVFSALKMGTSAVIFKLLSYVFGREFLSQLSEFLLLFKDMYQLFQERHEEVLRTFASDSTSFVTICAPTPPSLDVAGFFQRELGQRGYPRGGILINQVDSGDQDAADVHSILGPLVEAAGTEPQLALQLMARAQMAHERYGAITTEQADLIQEFKRGLRGHTGFVKEIPRVEWPLHDLSGLKRLGEHILE